MIMPQLDQYMADQLNETYGFDTPETKITVEMLNAPLEDNAELDALFEDDKEEIGHLKFQGQEFVNEDNENKSRPQTFEGYIGQERAKKTVKIAIEAAKKQDRPLKHLLIHGYSGLGKSTIAYIIAGKDGLGLPSDRIIETTGGAVEDKKALAELLQKLAPVKGTHLCSYLFIDEVHGLPRVVGEALYSCLEDFKFEGQVIPPFTFVGATTEMGALIKNLEPLVNRCDLQIELKAYEPEHLQKIILNLSQKSLPIDDNSAMLLAKRCRKTARTSVRLYGRCLDMAVAHDKGLIDEKVVLDTMEIEGVNDMGLTIKDIELLKYLDNKGVVGLSGIAQRLRTSEQGYLYHTEPFLVEMDFIERTPRGRALANCGREYLDRLNV